ncbi:MAG TPA: AMP-binding protein [Vicinamibacterales bacterium]|nr:AMP-binding protein [Vicinamibacterales bacterium]
MNVGLDDSLARDLGLGSLERVELMMRLEQASGVRLPESAAAEAETLRHILRALGAGGRSTHKRIGEHEPAAARPGGAAPVSTRTLTQALRWQADRAPARVHLFLREDTGRERPITYGELWRDAERVAAGLRDRGVAPGERVALLLRTEQAFFQAYFGILLAGGVPVPLYPPFRAVEADRNTSVQVLPQRVRLDGLDDARADIGERTKLQRDAPGGEVLDELRILSRMRRKSKH